MKPMDKQEREQKGGHVRRRGKGEGQGEQDNARAPLARRTLHGMGYAHRGVKRGKQPKGGENLIVGISTGVDHGRTKAVQSQRDKAAGIAEQTPRHPPQRAPQEDSGEQETAVQQQQDVAEFVAHLPGGSVRVLAGKRCAVGSAAARRPDIPGCHRECCRRW